MDFLQRRVLRLVAPDGGAEHVTGVRIDGVIADDDTAVRRTCPGHGEEQELRGRVGRVVWLCAQLRQSTLLRRERGHDELLRLVDGQFVFCLVLCCAARRRAEQQERQDEEHHRFHMPPPVHAVTWVYGPRFFPVPTM